MDDGRAHDVHGAALTPKLVLVLLLRRSARWGMIGIQQTSQACHGAPRRRAHGTNQAGRYTSVSLAPASYSVKPELGDYQQYFLASHPFGLSSAYLLRPHQLLANPICSRCECWLKNRTISAEASGPLGSVYEPEKLPPDHACPSPWTVQRSTMARPPASR
jgi:hypothetical protein